MWSCIGIAHTHLHVSQGQIIQGNFSSAKEWSTGGSVPAEVVNAESVNSFKNAYDRSHQDMDDRS